MYLKKIIWSLWLLIAGSIAFSTNAKDYEQDYWALKNSNCVERKCADSLFRIVYVLANEAPDRADSLSVNFSEYAALQTQDAYWNAKAALLAAYLNYYFRYNIPTAFQNVMLAIRFFEKEQPGKDLCFAYQILASIYSDSRNYKLADETESKALKIAKALDNPVLIGNSYNAMGINYNFEKKYDKAKQVFLDMAKLLEHSSDKLSYARALLNIGTAYRNLKQFDSAFYYNEKGRALALQLNDRQQLAYADNDKGSFYVFQKQYAQALPFLENAQKIREEQEDSNELFWTYIFLGDSYVGMKRIPQGQQFYHKAIQLAAANGRQQQQYEAYLRLSEMYAQHKKYDSAYFYNNKYAQLKDSVTQSRKDIATDIFIASYELGEKEQNILQLNEAMKASKSEIQKQRFWLAFAILMAVVLLVIILQARKLKKQQFGQLKLEQSLAEESSKRLAEESLRKEQERIARDLHDNVGSQLSYIIYSLDGINDYDATKRIAITESIAQSVRGVIGNLRETIWLISENGTHLQDFSDRLKVFARAMFKLSTTKVNFEENIEMDTELNALQSLNLYRICQEILTNAFKHSEAANVYIQINFKDNVLQINIADDGKGFNVESRQGQGYGLSNIGKRASESGIEVAQTSISESGTKYLLTMNVKPQ